MSGFHRHSASTSHQNDHALYPARRRTWSLLSSSSALSANSTTRLLVVPDPRLTTEGPDKHSAWGSFVPLSSATPSLRAIAAVDVEPLDDESDSEAEVPYTVAIEKSRPYVASLFHSSQSPPRVPLITRTLTAMPPRPPSPDSSASSINQDVVGRGSNQLHPVLARMERASKLCTQKLQCSTCRKPGRDYPQCGKCKQMWCSRECRLVGGKRHVCPGK